MEYVWTDQSFSYNRDENLLSKPLKETIAEIASPVFGSSASFSSIGTEFEIIDGVKYYIPYSVNSLKGEFNLKYLLSEEEAFDMIAFLESMTTGEATAHFNTIKNNVEQTFAKTYKNYDYKMFKFTDGSGIYRDVFGYCESYTVRMEKPDIFSIDLKMVADLSSITLDWLELPFSSKVIQEWASGRTFGNCDVCYYSTGSELSVNGFFFRNIPSTIPQGPSSQPDGNPMRSPYEGWSKNWFPFIEEDGFSIQGRPDIKKLNFKNSMPQRIKGNYNVNKFNETSMKISGLTNEETKVLLAFLELRKGYLGFNWMPARVYNRPKVMIAKKWTHTWDFFNSNSVTVYAEEDALGVANYAS
jgi:phage-related protein